MTKVNIDKELKLSVLKFPTHVGTMFSDNENIYMITDNGWIETDASTMEETVTYINLYSDEDDEYEVVTEEIGKFLDSVTKPFHCCRPIKSIEITNIEYQ